MMYDDDALDGGLRDAQAAIQRASVQVSDVLNVERRRRGLSLDSLARRAGISPGLLSQLQRNIGNPSLETISRLAYALEIPITRFFYRSELRSSAAGHGQKTVLEPDDGPSYELLSPQHFSSLAVLRIRIPSRWTNRQFPFQHEGQEVVHVLEGKVTIYVGSAEPVVLQDGDSTAFQASESHWYENGGEETLVLSAMSPATF